MSLVISPLMLINEITSQESKYLEQETKRLATSSGEELPFLIITVLDDIIEKDFIVSNWKDKNMIPKLAFNLWSSSRLYSENLNSSIILLDTNYRIISDFSISPLNINSDSVTNYIIKNKAIFIRGGEDTLQFEEDEDAESNMIAEGVIQNSDLKFYAGLRPVYFQPGGNPDFKELLGYLIAAIQYDTKSYYSAKHFEFFKGTKPDRLTNKLTSQPIYSEFSDGEMAGTSNYDVSKSLIKTLDMLRSSLEGKIDKSTLRFDQIENNLYKTYFVIVEPVKNQPEKIYAVSIKVNDINGFVFFFLKCLLVSTLIYLIFLILYTIYITIKHFIKSRRLLLFAFGFREKLFVSFFVVSVIPVLILALYSREYVESKNNKTAVNEIISDLKLVEQYIKSKLDWTDIKLRNKGVDDKLILQSNIFGKSFAESDKIFNFFVKNKLTSTTNEELYKSDLLETRISGNAYYNLVLLKRDFFIENQEIGVFRFVSGYKPVYDRYFNLIGIVSTLTLFRQYEIDTEITESLVYIFGTYLIAIVFLIVVVNILASRISNPIIKLMQATEDLSRGKTDIQLPVTTRDEIGELVKSFNRMTIELKRSREELKKAERESAWRDIARQVAHEIKNPLTPMKLAIQHLYYAYIHSSKDFKTIIHNTNKLIIDQIETLNRIATEFSDFAKLPRRNYVPINMNEIIKDTVKLLKSQSNIIIDIGKSAINTLILGDKDELKRVLINIIRNSTQAIEQKTYFEGEGRILISTYSKGQTYFLKIQDNGIGMDEQTQQKLFEPYFSTKSTGMGLGLVITKKILDDMGSKITLNSKLNEGTEVLISFPIKKL
jgi:nitrogen fixation/metabolism regulation signal transduction histidine kinase